jgi:uncharacterized membrane protein
MNWRLAASLLAVLVVAVPAPAPAQEDIRYVSPGEAYYLKGVLSDELVTVTAVDRDRNQVKIRRADGTVDWVSPSRLLTRSKSVERDVTRGAALLGGIAVLLCAASDDCKAPAPASREFRVCNKTQGKLYSAVAFETSTGWQTKGWYAVAPARCELVASGFVGDRVLYFANDDQDGVWRGTIETCVDRVKAFAHPWSNKCGGLIRLSGSTNTSSRGGNPGP